jgi:hypothetical protein
MKEGSAYLLAGRKRGVRFDLGHGGSFCGLWLN